jgi:hypothetical protein
MNKKISLTNQLKYKILCRSESIKNAKMFSQKSFRQKALAHNKKNKFNSTITFR